MRYLFTFLCVGLLLTGCQAFSQFQGKSSSRGSEPETAVIPSGFAGFTDMPVPGGASMNVEKSLIFGDGDTWTGRVVMTASQGIAPTYDFYLADMPNYGWKHITSVRSEISVLTYIRGNRVATIAMEPRHLGTAYIEFTVSPRGEGVAPSPKDPAPRREYR